MTVKKNPRRGKKLPKEKSEMQNKPNCKESIFLSPMSGSRELSEDGVVETPIPKFVVSWALVGIIWVLCLPLVSEVKTVV